VEARADCPVDGCVFAADAEAIAAGAELRFGIDAERRSLESIAEPLSAT